MVLLLLLPCLIDVFLPADRSLLRTAHALVDGYTVVGWPTGSALYSPMGVVTTSTGDLLIADTDNDRVQLCRGSRCKTVAGGNGRGEGANQLYMPYAAVATVDMKVFIADTHNQRIQLWEPDAREGISVLAPSEGLKDPCGVFLDEPRNHLYVVDVGKHRIQRYDFESNGSVVRNSGITVAGITGSYGNDTGRLDNPTDAVLDTDRSLWLADARNSRIMHWPAFDGTMAPNGSAEVQDLFGRPYGVYVADDHLYYGDADECVIYKRAIYGFGVGDEVVPVAGGFGCGGSSRQLSFPSQFLVTATGALVVADSGNNRIMRWGPQPERADQICTLSLACTIVLYKGNPISSNMIVIITRGPGSECGGPCLSANLTGPYFTNYSMTTGRGLRNSTFQFGPAMMGVQGDDYQLCWGPAPDLEAFFSGDCTSLPWTVGKMTLAPVVYEDYHAEYTHCVKGAPCRVNITAYAMPNTSMLSSPPEAYGISGGSSSPEAPLCGVSLENTFTGYRAHLALNPAISLGAYYPYEAEGNLTTWLAYDFGIALGIGRLPLCLCTEGIECFQPFRFRYHAGTLRIRSSVGKEVYKCHQWENCSVTVLGMFLQIDDRVRVIDVRGICGDGRFPVLNGTFETSISNATSVDEDGGGRGGDYRLAEYDLGMSHEQGRFQLCYCASYDGEDDDNVTCNSVDEFTQSAGVIQVYRTNNTVYRCTLDEICYITVNGSMLGKTDKLIAELGDPGVCGVTPPVPVWTNGGNLYTPVLGEFELALGDNYTKYYNLSAFEVPGVYQICYCTSFDYLNAGKSCTYAIEYYQVVGPLLVRGPLDSVLLCVGEKNCTVGVKGIELAMLDRLQICYDGGRSCRNTPCRNPPSSTNTSVFGPHDVDNSSYWSIAAFELGVLSVGTYRLCYCSTGIFANSSEGAYCEEPPNMEMKAAELRVRGVLQDGLYTCIADSGCTLIIPGYELRSSDSLMVRPLYASCGQMFSSAGEVVTFLPSARSYAKPGTSSRRWRQFEFANAGVPGHYRVCYCVELGCHDTEMYHLNAGLLFVKGFIENEDASLCQLGEQCSLQVKGYGLREINDTVQAMPVKNLCSGAQVLVDGDMNATGLINGTYMKGEGLWDERVWYVNEHGQHMFFDVFATRWVLGPEMRYEFPDEPPWAWAPGLTAMTPDQITEPWVIYDQMAAFPGQNFLGGWVPSTIAVRRSTSPPGVFGDNPTENCTDTVRDDVLGYPYTLGAQFHLGKASELGVYRICYCASIELGDFDNVMCSNDDEFLAAFGMLVVHIVRGGERYHCAQHLPCTIRTVLLAGWYPTVLAGALLPGGSQCHLVAVEVPVRNSLAQNSFGQMIDGEVVFDLGVLSLEGTYEFCVCTMFDGHGRKLVPEDFFQHAGTLTISPVIRMEFVYGQESMFNLSRGSGLSRSDKLRFLPGDSCDVPESPESTVQSTNAVEVDNFGAWAAYPINDEGSAARPGGLYTACLCANFQGIDRDRIPCNSWNEFRSRVGTIVVSTIKKPLLVTSVSSSLQLMVRGARRLSAQRRLTTFEALRSAAVASLIANAIQDTIALAIPTEPSAVSVFVVDLLPMQLSPDTLTQGTSVSTGGVTVGLRVLFNATLSGSEEQLVKSGCEVPEDTSSDWLRECLTLVHLLGNETSKTRVLAELQTQLDATSLPGGVRSITALGIEELSAVGFSAASLPVMCARGLVCEAEIQVTAPLSSNHGLLVINEEYEGELSICGPTVGWPGTAVASSRGAAGFLKNPVLAVGSGEMKYSFGLDFPQLPGKYAMCFCRTDGVGRLNSSVAGCTLNMDFASTAGTLTIRGSIPGQLYTCLVGASCNVRIRGVELSAWDRVFALNTSAPCGVTGFEEGIERNPASSLVTASLTDHDYQTFDFGVISEIGALSVCYCSSLAQAAGSVATCADDAEFVAHSGVLAVRGANTSGARLSCAKYDVGSSTCAFEITGLGLWPEADSVMITDVIGSDCRTGVAPTSGVRPAQMTLEAGEMAMPWPSSWPSSWPVGDVPDPRMRYVTVGTWRVQYPLIAGEYRICFCTAATEPGEYSGGCRSGMDFFHHIGSLTVRGAVGGEVYTCREGGNCKFQITGYGLSKTDSIMLVSPSEVCGKGRLKFEAAEINPASSVDVNADGTHATFDLGFLRRDSRGYSVTALVCYCAAEDNDGDGQPCQNATEFTHSAGYMNSVICPPLQNETSFFPPVEDVFGDPGEPHVKLYSKPVWICATATGAVEQRYKEFTISLGPGETISLNDTGVISSDEPRCTPRIAASLAEMNMQVSSVIEMRVKVEKDNQHDRQSLLLSSGPILQGQPRVNITVFNSFTCPAWEVQLVPLACGWAAAFQYALILRIVPIVALILVCTRKHGLASIRYVFNLLTKIQQDVEQDAKKKEAEQNPQPSDEKPGTRTSLPGGKTSFLGFRLSTVNEENEEDTASKTNQSLNEKRPKSVNKPRVDARYIDLLSSHTLAIVIMIIRLGTVGVQVWILFMFDTLEDYLFLVIMPLGCVGAAILTQFMILFAGNGCAGLRAGFSWNPLMVSMITLAKTHLDLWLPWIARQHHCEVWRPAVVLNAVVILQQVLWPAGILMTVLRPSRRIVLQKANGYTRDSIVMEVTKPPGASRTDGLMAMATDSGANRMGLGMQKRKPNSPKNYSANRNSGSSLKRCCRGMLKGCQATKRGFARFVRVSFNRGVARALIFVSRSISAPPELEHRERLAAMYMFMETSGWHVVGVTVRSTVERALSMDLSFTIPRCRVACLVASGVDLTVLNALVLTGYASRLSTKETAVLAVAMVLGVLQIATPGLLQMAVERACENITGPVSVLFMLLSLLLIRLIVFIPLAAGCPNFTWAFTLSACSVLVIEVPMLAIYAWQRWLRMSLLKKDADGLKGPSLESKDSNSLANIALWLPAPPSAPPPMLPDIHSSAEPSQVVQSTPFPSVGLNPAMHIKSIGDSPVQEKQSDLHMGARYSMRPGARVTVQDRPAPKHSVLIQSLVQSVPAYLSQSVEDPHVEISQFVSRLSQELTARALRGQHKVNSKQQNQEAVSKRTIALHRLAGNLFSLQNISERMQCIGRMFDAIIEIEDLLFQLDYEIEISLAFALRALIEDEFDRTCAILRAVRITRTQHFRRGTLLSRDELAQNSLKGLPKFHLIHWLELMNNQTLPPRGETERMVLASEAFERHRSKLVVIVVIGGEDTPELTARRLIKFAEWYRRRWGRRFEPHFWIERTCLPDTIRSLGKPEQAVSGARASDQTDFGNRDSAQSSHVHHRSSSKRSVSSEVMIEALESLNKLALETMSNLSTEAAELITEEASDAFLSVAFASCDAFLFCELESCEQTAWARLELALARALAPKCRIYCIDKKFARPKTPMAKDRFSQGRSDTRPASAGTRPGSQLSLDSFAGTMALPGTPGEDHLPMQAIANGEESQQIVSYDGDDPGSPKALTWQDPEISHDTFAGATWAVSKENIEVGRQQSMVSRVEEFDFDMYTKAEIVTTAQDMQQYETWCILDPTDWSCATTKMERDKGRVRRLASACLFNPAKASAGLRCKQIDFGTTTITVCKVNATGKRRGRQAVRLFRTSLTSNDQDNEDTSPSSGESSANLLEQQSEAFALAREKRLLAKAAKESESRRLEKIGKQERMVYDKGAKIYGDTGADHMYLQQDAMKQVLDETGARPPSALRFKPIDYRELMERGEKKGAERPKPPAIKFGADLGAGHNTKQELLPHEKAEVYPETVLRRAAVAKSLEAPREIPPLPPLRNADPDLFHPSFHAAMITISRDGLMAEQLQNFLNKRGDSNVPPSASPNGGMAVTMHALGVRKGMIREAPDALGVCMKVAIDDIDSRWKDGFSIGFTAQDPEEWSERRKPPRNARQLKRHWLVSSTGKWELEGHTEFIRSVQNRPAAWTPASLLAGDVVTVVMGAPPACVFRVLVNDQVVAERIGATGLPDPQLVPLWGAVDVDGRCLKVHLLPDTNPHPRIQQHLLVYDSPDENSPKSEIERPDSPFAKLRRGSRGIRAPPTPLLGSNRNRVTSASRGGPPNGSLLS